jgi:putative ABC transport system permease protein
MFKNYLLITFRNLLKNKLFIFINVLGIGLAVACCITAYLNWQFNEKWDAVHKNSESIYRVQFNHEFQGRVNQFGIAPMPLGNFVKQNVKDVDEVIRFVTNWGDFRIKDELFATPIAYADSAFFETFTYELLYGNFNDFKDKNTVFIDHETAQRYFGKQDVVGQPLTQIIAGKPKEYVVGGVFKKLPLNSSFDSEVITLFANYWEHATDINESGWAHFNTTFLRINDPSKVSSITQQLQRYVEPQNHAREDLKVHDYFLAGFKGLGANGRASHVQENWLRTGPPPVAITVPIIMATFLLLLACFNFTNTSIAVSSKRLKEIGVRKVMGGMRSQMILQFLGENFLLCFFGLVVGLLIAEFMVPAYDSMWTWLDLSFTYTENWGIILFLLGLLFVTALIAGSYPAFYVTSFEPVSILKGKAKFGGTNIFTRVLLGLQFFISLLAIIFSVAFQGNAVYQRNYDLGYLSNGVISVWIGNESDFNTYRDALSSNKDILSIAGTKDHVSTSWYHDPVKHESIERKVDIMDVGDDYLNTMDIKLVSGRVFKKDSETDRKESVLVTEEFIREFGWKDDPLGKRLIWHDSVQLYIVGVVKNIYARALWEPIQPMMIRYTSPNNYRQLVVKTSPEKIVEINEFMEEKWEDVFTNSVYNGRMITESLAETLQINDNIVKMFSFLGFFAVLLSVSGLYTLVSLNIIKKMKEIGVRKVLGASVANIARVINLEFVIILSIAGLLGGVAAYFLTDMIMAGIWEYYKKLDMFSFAISIAIMFLVAGLAVGFKTVTTASLNPTKTLRDE